MGAISWKSKKQISVALSTTEAEYVSLSTCFQEAIWLQGLQTELIPTMNKIKLFCDNQSALCLAKNHMYSARTKHIDVKHNFIRDLIEQKEFNIDYVTSDEMLADLLTKPLSLPRLNKLCSLIGIKSRGDVD